MGVSDDVDDCSSSDIDEAGQLCMPYWGEDRCHDDDQYDDDDNHDDDDTYFRGWPVTGIIVEPIQAEGGDHHGSNAWFQVEIKMMIMVVVINMVKFMMMIKMMMRMMRRSPWILCLVPVGI